MERRHDTSHRDRRGHPSAALDTISRALQRADRSPFSDKIECTKIPRRFNCPPFTCYDDKIDPVEHVSHYIQIMSLYSQKDELMCNVYSSNLGPTTMR